jgi:type VI secretion system protein ImpE
MGVWTYRAILHAEQTRQEMFAEDRLPGDGDPPTVQGTLNGRPFDELTDADPRIGARLEVLAGGQYTWIPLHLIASIDMEPPKRLRDLMWAPANVRTGADVRDFELGEVILPALAPGTWKHPDDAVRLGRETDWVDLDDELAAPVGQKLLVVDGELFPILELRELRISGTSTAGS